MTVDKKITAEAWAVILIEKWRKEIERLKIRNTGDLYNSFEKLVHAEANGDLQRIELAYNFYGYFVDIGVGKGQKLEDVGANNTDAKLLGSRARKPKRWVGKILSQEAWKLAEIMEKKYGDEGMAAIYNSLPGKITL